MRIASGIFFFISLLSCSILMKAGTNRLDSLENLLRQSKTDTGTIALLIQESDYFFKNEDPDKSIDKAGQALALAEKLDNKSLIAKAQYAYGRSLDLKGELNKAIEHYEAGLEQIGSSGFEKERSRLEIGIANAFYFKGNREKSLTHYLNALRMMEQIGDSSGMAGPYMGIANVYSDMNENDKCIEYNKKALDIKLRQHDDYYVSLLYNNLGSAYRQKKDSGMAMLYFKKAIDLKTKLGDEADLATTYSGIGGLYFEHKNYSKSLEYYFKCYRIRLKTKEIHELASSMGNIATIYLYLDDYDKSLHFVDSAILLGERIHSYDLLKRNYKTKSEDLYFTGKYKEAYEFHRLFALASDTVLNASITAQMNEMNAKYESDKKEQKIALQDSELNRANNLRNFILGFSGLTLLLLLVLYRGYRNKRRTNELLETKNQLIQQQKILVEEKNKDITDSIHYAKRIQDALLPSDEVISRMLPDSFVLFKPKDIVSGDFYMVEQWGKDIIVAAVDCTGHGVPGAFMSFMAHNLFNEAVNEHGISQPSIILNEMRKGLSRSLGKKEENNESVKDGMDVAILSLDLKAMELQYAGAFNPLWIIRSEQADQIEEIKADKQPVGLFRDNVSKPFTNHKLKLEHGDILYIFSDGYADQFGGPKGKKFKYKALQDLLLKNKNAPMRKQKEILEKTLTDWKGHLEQVDDVLLIGIRV